MIRRNTWIILAVFIALLALVFYWQRTQEDAPEATPTPGQKFLFGIEETSIKNLRISDEQGRVLVIGRDEDGVWTLIEPPAEETDLGSVESAMTQLVSLSILSTLNTPPALDALGLAPPEYKILIDLDDGGQIIANVGKTTPTGSGYYVLTSDRSVHVVNKFGLEAVIKLLENPPIVLTPTSTLSATSEPGFLEATASPQP